MMIAIIACGRRVKRRWRRERNWYLTAAGRTTTGLHHFGTANRKLCPVFFLCHTNTTKKESLCLSQQRHHQPTTRLGRDLSSVPKKANSRPPRCSTLHLACGFYPPPWFSVILPPFGNKLCIVNSAHSTRLFYWIFCFFSRSLSQATCCWKEKEKTNSLFFPERSRYFFNHWAQSIRTSWRSISFNEQFLPENRMKFCRPDENGGY